jgi:uncharacterized protein involved in exopolysaccharide biosynthesis
VIAQSSPAAAKEVRAPINHSASQPEAVPQSNLGEGSIREAAAPSSAIPRLRLLWQGRRLLFRSTLAGLLLGTLIAFLLPKRFESRTQLMPPDSRSNSGMAMAALAAKGGGALGGMAGDLLGLKSSGALFIGILTSATVEDRLVDRFGLEKVYGERLREEARRKLEESTAISEDRKSGIITITIADRDPRRAAAIGRAYIEELDRLVGDLSTSAAHRERVFLEERLQTVKQELDQAAKELSQFESKNTAIDIKEQGKSIVDAAAILMGQLIAAESELKGLEQIYTSNNVRIQSVEARIAELRRQLEKMHGQSGGESGAAGVRGNSLYPSIRELPMLGVTYADLYRRTKIKEVVYETLTQEYELARVQEVEDAPSVKVLDIANVPQKKAFPPRTEIVLLCSFLSLIGAAAWILARGRWEQIEVSSSSGKALALEVFERLNTRMPWAPPNGSRLQAMTHWVWTRFGGSNGISSRV